MKWSDETVAVVSAVGGVIGALIVVVAFTLVLATCLGAGADAVGAVGSHCRSDGTCNAGLICAKVGTKSLGKYIVADVRCVEPR